MYPSLEIDFGRLYQIKSNKQAHFLFSKAILNVERARTATADFAKYHRLGTYNDEYHFLFFYSLHEINFSF